MLIPSDWETLQPDESSLSRGMNANSQLNTQRKRPRAKSIKRDEC